MQQVIFVLNNANRSGIIHFIIYINYLVADDDIV
jgi:hypothetical protein